LAGPEFHWVSIRYRVVGLACGLKDVSTRLRSLAIRRCGVLGMVLRCARVGGEDSRGGDRCDNCLLPQEPVADQASHPVCRNFNSHNAP
jgi:hypothetical protein